MVFRITCDFLCLCQVCFFFVFVFFVGGNNRHMLNIDEFDLLGVKVYAPFLNINAIWFIW